MTVNLVTRILPCIQLLTQHHALILQEVSTLSGHLVRLQKMLGFMRLHLVGLT